MTGTTRAIGTTRESEAHRLLWQHWQAGSVLETLPPSVRPANRADGYAIQAEIEGASAHPLFGWKIAATSTAGQRHINVEGPLAGRLIAERAFADGATLLFGANRMAVVEAEFAFVMGQDLPPRLEPYELDEVLAAVAALHPALEIPDSRFADFTKVGASQLIADNACAHEFVLGPTAPSLWRDLDLSAHTVDATVSGPMPLQRQGAGSNVLGDPRTALTWLVNELSGLGTMLSAGCVVTTGTCLNPLPVAPGCAVVADYGPLGRVSLAFASA
jgi:2-keto-4-pentenoate hydratase